MQSGSSLSTTPVFQVTFRDNGTEFAVLHVLQGTSLGEAFPAAPAKAGIRFLGWYNGNTQVTSSTIINNNITVTAKWEFYGNGTEAIPYQIPSADAWDFLAYNVNNGDAYSEKVFQMTNNISVTTMVGPSTYDGGFKYFSGTFDGDGKTLNVELVGTTECTAAFSALDNATIKNLHITGSINTPNVRPASIAGFVNGSSTIENCWSEVAISSTHSNDWVDAGAFVARVNGNQSLTLTGCLFTGSMTYKNTAYEGGGMVGWTRQDATVTLNNCVFAPSAINITKTYDDQYVFVTGLAQKNINDCYYNDVANSSNLTPEPAAGSKLAYSITAGTNVNINNLGTYTDTYNVSGITAYLYGIKCNGTYYAGGGESVSLNLDNTSHSGYSLHGYSVTSGSLANPTTNTPTLTMPAADVIIQVSYSASKSITGYSSDTNGWYLISSPMVENQNPSSVTNMTANTYDLFRYNQNAEMEWQNYKTHNSDQENPFNALVSGKGYLYANSNIVTLTFVGTPYSGNGVVNLEYSTANPDSRIHGWNLIGNPFGTTATIDKAFYRMNGTHTEIITSLDNNIAPMEGIFVRATGSGQSVTFTLGGSKGGERNTDNLIINLSYNNGTVIDRAIVSFDEGRTMTKLQIDESNTKLYIPQNGEDYAIAFSNRTGELPLHFVAKEIGRYTITVETNDNASLNGVSLIDKHENTITDLSLENTYSFIGSVSDNPDRFVIVFKNSQFSDNYDIFAYQSGNDIIVNGEGELQVFDVMGRMVAKQQINGVQTMSTSSLRTGVYIFRLNEKTQKIVIK